MIDPTSSIDAPAEAPQSASKRSRLVSALSRMWVPVRVKITLPFILIAIAMAVFVAFLLYQIVFENIDQRYNTQLVESGKLAAEWMVQEENTRLATLRILAFTSGVGDALQARDAEALRLAALGNTIGNQEDAVEFLTPDGDLVLSIRHRPGSLDVDDYIFAKTSEVDYLQWPFVKQVIDRYADIQGDKFSGLARAPWGDYFYVTGPVFDSTGKFAGVIMVGRLMTNLVNQMSIKTRSQVSFYDLSGQVIASTYAPPALTAPVIDVVFERETTSSQRRDISNKRDLSYKTIDYGELLGPWKLRSNEELGLIGTALPKNLLVQTSDVSRIQIVTFVGLVMFFVIMMGGYIANLITHPLLELVNASKEVARGNFKIKVKPHANDEVAVLTENFNLMITSIEQSHADLVKAYNSTLEGWSRATGLRDNETEAHIQRVTDITVKLAQYMGIGGDLLVHIYRGTLLHDVGKIGVPDAILRKPGKLTADEWVLMRQHPQFAYDMLISIEYLRPSIDIPYCHHEKWDGSGYPRGIKGADIPLIARIFTIVDVWDAMTSDRVYRKAMDDDDAYEYITTAKGKHFDPQVVDAFMSMMNRNNGHEGSG